MNVKRGLLRVWVVVSVLYVAIAAPFAVTVWRDSFPAAPALATQSASDLNHGSQSSAAEKQAPAPVRPPSRDMANFTPIDTSPAAPGAAPTGLAKFQAADAASDAALKSGASQAPAAPGAAAAPADAAAAPMATSHAETMTVLLLLALVLGPPVALLLAGIAMMWVVRGFRRDPA